MTGPEHYREAERLLDVAADFAEIHDQAIAIAQAHATLALAAATALGAGINAATASLGEVRVTSPDLTEWATASGVQHS